MSDNINKSKLKVISTKQLNNAPPSIRSVKVRNFRDAKRLLSRLIGQLQKEEITGTHAKDLTYLLSQFIVLEKANLDFQHLQETFEIEFVKNIEYLNGSWDALMLEVAEELGFGVFEKIHDKYRSKLSSIEKKVRENVERSVERFRKDKNFPSEILKNDLSFEEVELLIINKCRQFSQNEIDEIIQKISKIGTSDE